MENRIVKFNHQKGSEFARPGKQPILFHFFCSSSRQVFLCAFQSCLWQSLLQQPTFLHLLHWLRGPALLQRPHRCCSVGKALIFRPAYFCSIFKMKFNVYFGGNLSSIGPKQGSRTGGFSALKMIFQLSLLLIRCWVESHSSNFYDIRIQIILGSQPGTSPVFRMIRRLVGSQLVTLSFSLIFSSSC